MWSNISAPKSGLKAAQVGHQVKQQDSSVLDQQENNQELSNPYSSKTVSGSPLMRYKHAVCSSQSGFIYIHGGRFSNGVPLDDDVWRFDPHENRWLQLKTSGCRPPSLQEHTLSEYQEQLYLFGGQVSAASGQENFFWRLDLAKCQWTSLSMDASNCSSLKFGVRLGPTNRRGHSACVYRDSIYIFGGYEDFRGSTNQLWQYDLLNERWELRNLSSSSACHPEPRHNHSAVIYQDSMFIYGGLSNLKPLGDLWRWSWKDKRWFREKTRGQSPGQLHGHTAIQAFGSMFVFGGERQNGRTTRSLWRLNLSNLCWQKIKPKGPRPNPTTWHAAIANPLGILDEANYLIEGDASDLEMDQQQQQLQDQPHEELVLFVNQQQRHHQQSLSDNSFSTHMQQTIPMETIRPITLNNTDNHHHQQQQHKLTGAAEVQLLQQRAPRTLANNNNHHHQQRTGSSRLKVSKSSSEQMSCLAKQAASQTGLRDRVTKPKRRLRLSFLRRNNSKNKKGCEAKQLPTSWSAASILNASSISGASSQQQHRQQPNESVAQKRHSVAIPETSAISVQSANDIEMVNLDLADGCGAEQPSANQESINETNVSILDNLDSDIKGMFQRAMSPADGEHDDHHQEALPTTGTFKRDSMTQSQLSSCIGPATTQTYQTAREQLSSQSTLTITLPGDELKQSSNAAIVNTASNNKQLADVRQRKSMHQLNQSQLRRNTTNEGQQQQQLQRTTRGRPKSEIVQSLIDRADARIKHLYTPYFNPDANQQHQHQAHERNGHEHHQQQQQQKQQLPPRFSSNDPILGELANHRMFERSDSNGRRAVGLDKSKRHTIHQTMTYYNLYFAEDRRLDGSSGADSSSSPPATSDEAGGKQQGISPMEKDNVNATNTNSSSNGTNDKSLSSGNNQYANNSTSAALIGVHDGASSSGGDSSQRTLFLGRLESEVGSLMASSDSRTLCADLNNGGAHFRHNNKYQKPDCHEAQDREQNGFGSSQRMSESVASDELNNAADNTSLSFSVIAEFEEDDMLQYSSPTDLVMERRSRRSGRDDDEEEEDVRDNDYQEEEGSMQEEHQEPEESHDNLDDRMASDEKHQTTGRMKIPQKSSSSGYDSIQSAKSSNIDRDRQQQHHDTSSYSACSTGDSPQVSNSCLNHNNNPNHNNNRQCDDSDEKHFRQTTVIKREPGTMNANMTNTTTASSTTTESLALTTNDTNTSEFCPLTPPSKSLPSSPPDSSQISGTGIDTSTRQHSSFASSLMSGPSRLFGKKKTTKTRYWQLCMFVIGGKQQGGNHNAGNLNEPIAIWRLYI